MSSGSGDDEFYDAQDVTPVRQNRLLSVGSLSETESLNDLERQEHRLLEHKRLIEEKRRLEEAEIQKKLASLDRRKQKEREKQEAAQKARENEQRRHKLEEMRRFMSDEGTPDRPTPDPFRFSGSLEVGAQPQTRDAADRLLSGTVLEEKLEALSFELEQSGHLNRGDFLGRKRSCDINKRSNSRGSGDRSFYGGDLDRTTQSLESDCFEDAGSERLPPLVFGCNKSSSLNTDLHASLLDSASLDAGGEGARVKSSSLPVQLSMYPSEISCLDLVHKPALQEPDIIQSTKSLPRAQPATSTPKAAPPGGQGEQTTPPVLGLAEPSIPGLPEPVSRVVLREKTEPVAPPRRKKSGRSSGISETNRDSCGSSLSTDSDRLSVGGPGLSGQGLGLSGQGIAPGQTPAGRPSLDLSSAIQGNCHVLATEETAVKGDNLVEADSGSMETLLEEDERSSTSLRQDHRQDQPPGGDSTMDDLDVVIIREDSVTEDLTGPQGPHHEIHGAHHAEPRRHTPHLARQKSKTLGGSTAEELRRARAQYSGSKVLTDKEILEHVIVTNLDTGEKIPLGDADSRVPPTMNPLSLHIMKLTNEYPSERPTPKGSEDTEKSEEQGKTVKTLKVPKKRGKKIKKFLSKSVRKIKSELKSMKEDRNSSSDEDEFVDGRRMIKIKASHSHKGPYDFDLLVPVQNLAEDSGGAVWTMKFSHCGRLLATGGQDNILKIWVLKSGYAYFDGMRQKYSEAARVSPTPSQESALGDHSSDRGEDDSFSNLDEEEDGHAPFMRLPFCVYKGHTADLLDVSWSKNYFILSSSMDKTVRLWHVSRKECLCCFQHIDFVTAIAFHPKDDRYFLSGSLDGKLRLWSIPEKKVALWNEVSGQSKLITAANFCTDGKIAVGTYDGRCVLYTADIELINSHHQHLDYHTQIHVRSTRGKNAKGGKITGVDPYPGENKILVTSNDSRIRLYDLRDKTLTCKYKGSANNSSRIKASFSHDGSYIICGSEDGCVYIWRTQHDFYKFYSVRRDRNDYWEGVKAHVAVVTAAIFAPCPSLIIRPQFQFMDADDKELTAGVRGEVIISADFSGAIKVFINKFKPGSGYE